MRQMKLDRATNPHVWLFLLLPLLVLQYEYIQCTGIHDYQGVDGESLTDTHMNLGRYDPNYLE